MFIKYNGKDFILWLCLAGGVSVPCALLKITLLFLYVLLRANTCLSWWVDCPQFFLPAKTIIFISPGAALSQWGTVWGVIISPASLTLKDSSQVIPQLDLSDIPSVGLLPWLSSLACSPTGFSWENLLINHFHTNPYVIISLWGTQQTMSP